MPRVKRGTKRRASRKKTLALAKGFFLTKSKLHRSAQEAVEKSLRYGYVGRRLKKRDFRSLWIVRIGAACRAGRNFLQPLHGRSEESRRGSEPQNAGRYGADRIRRRSARW